MMTFYVPDGYEVDISNNVASGAGYTGMLYVRAGDDRKRVGWVGPMFLGVPVNTPIAYKTRSDLIDVAKRMAREHAGLDKDCETVLLADPGTEE